MPQSLHRSPPESSAAASLGEPRRAGEDRRKRPTPMLSKYTVFGRRRHNRRDTDPRSHYYVDWIEGWYLYTLIGILVLIAADALSTLHIISRGGGEANPLMRWMLERGPFWFIASKAATALAGFFLLAVHRFFSSARVLVTVLLLTYGTLVLYHIYLLIRIHT